MKTRFLLNIIAFISVFMFPWWAAYLVVFILFWKYQPYYEALLFGLMLDSLYIIRTPDVALFGFPFTFSFIILVFISLYIKDRVRIGI